MDINSIKGDTIQEKIQWLNSVAKKQTSILVGVITLYDQLLKAYPDEVVLLHHEFEDFVETSKRFNRFAIKMSGDFMEVFRQLKKEQQENRETLIVKADLTEAKKLVECIINPPDIKYESSISLKQRMITLEFKFETIEDMNKVYAKTDFDVFANYVERIPEEKTLCITQFPVSQFKPWIIHQCVQSKRGECEVYVEFSF